MNKNILIMKVPNLFYLAVIKSLKYFPISIIINGKADWINLSSLWGTNDNIAISAVGYNKIDGKRFQRKMPRVSFRI